MPPATPYDSALLVWCLSQDDPTQAPKGKHIAGSEQFVLAANQMTEREWLEYKKKNAAQAFHDSLKNVKNRESILLDIQKIKEIRKGEFLARGFTKVRQKTASTSGGVKFDMTMTWIKKNDKWKLLEVKELTPRKGLRAK